MTDKTYDVVAVGNAIVDILGRVDDAFIDTHGLTKGAMILAEENRTAQMYRELNESVERSGGSAANTVVGVASLGGTAAFIGKVKDDDHGHLFEKDLKSVGVHFETPKASSGAMTAQSMIAVTPDAERTMVTYLGATRGITEQDISEELIRQAEVLYLEGYLWDEEHAKNAMRKAVDYARAHGRKVALSLSDLFCVERHRDEFMALIDDHIDLLFCNNDELKSLFQTGDETAALEQVAKICDWVAVTKGSKGSVVVCKGQQYHIDVESGLDVIDTTGAGDLYASGFLFGYTRGHTPQECGQIATFAASEVIQHMGARPEQQLAAYIAEKQIKRA